MYYLDYHKNLEYWKNLTCNTPQKTLQAQEQIEFYQNKINQVFGKVSLELVNSADMIAKYQKKAFVIASYGAGRLAKMHEPKNPTKPNLQVKGKSSEALTNQFLYFLADLKIQEALARNERQIDDADYIKAWFDDFVGLLKEIYQDSDLCLTFNYKDYSFTIKTQGKEFKFTEMSDGFIAAIDIIADLILKMQDGDSLTHNYHKQGLVLIDEIETHLHLELQRIVMPLLTKIFPNIQFIVTTHSPFVLSSMPDAIAYDLESRTVIDDLTEYSYEALAEGYFGVKTDSSYMEMRLGQLQALLKKEVLSDNDKNNLTHLMKDFEQIPEAASPLLVGQFLQLKIEFEKKINESIK